MSGYLTKKDLTKRGWTKRDIKSIQPCGKTPNPERPFGAMQNLYDPDAVERYESSPEFKGRKHTKRSYEDRMAATKKWANQACINVMKNLSLRALGPDSLAIVRHEFTNYRMLLDGCHGRFGQEVAVKIVRRRVLAAILRAYKSLRPEAEEQWMRWYSERF